MRNVAIETNSSLTRVSGSDPMIDGVTVCDLAESPVTQMTARRITCEQLLQCLGCHLRDVETTHQVD